MIESYVKLNKIKSYIGFAKKSGNIKIGADNILASSKNSVIIVVEDISDNTFNKLSNYSLRKNIKLIRIKNDYSSYLFDSDKIKAIAVSDKNLATAIIEGIKNLEES